MISFAASPETSAPPGICQLLDPAPGWLDLRPGRVLHGSATPSASPSRLGVPGRPRSSPRSQSPRARPPSPPGRRLVLSVSAKVVGAWDVDPVHSYGWRRRGVGLDWMENPCPSKGFRPHSFPFSALLTTSVGGFADLRGRHVVVALGFWLVEGQEPRSEQRRAQCEAIS